MKEYRRKGREINILYPLSIVVVICARPSLICTPNYCLVMVTGFVLLDYLSLTKTRRTMQWARSILNI